MVISENLLSFIKTLGGLGLFGWVAGYSLTFVLSKQNERQMQRREIQYLHNSFTFILFAVFLPLFFSFVILDTFPKTINDNNVSSFLKSLGFFAILQLINIFIVLYMTDPSLARVRERSVLKLFTKYSKWTFSISLIVAFCCSISSFSFIILFYQVADIENRFRGVPILFLLYLALFIPYYIGLMRRLNKAILVEVHLSDGKILNNLLLSHRSFGKDLIFYDSDDKFQQKAVAISKDHIQMILNVEHLTDNKIDDTKKELKKFSSKVIRANNSNGKSTKNKRN